MIFCGTFYDMCCAKLCKLTSKHTDKSLASEDSGDISWHFNNTCCDKLFKIVQNLIMMTSIKFKSFLGKIMMDMHFDLQYQGQHHDVINWKHFQRYWPFVRGIHRLPVNSPHKGQWRGALMFSLIYAWRNGWVNNRDAGDLWLYHPHYEVSVMRKATWTLLLHMVFPMFVLLWQQLASMAQLFHAALLAEVINTWKPAQRGQYLQTIFSHALF